MSFDKKQAAAKKQRFLQQTKNKFAPKSFYDKHHLTTLCIRAGSYVLSIVSVGLGVTAMFALFQKFFGIDSTLLGMFDIRPLLAYSLLTASVLFLALVEFIKHKFNTEALIEQKRQSDDLGKIEKRIAFTAIAFSLIISAWGGILVSDELAGTKKTEKLTALMADFLPRIEAARADKQAYYDAKNYRKKISDKNIAEYNRLSAIVTDLETSFKNAKKEAGVSDGFVAATTAGTLQMAFLLGGSQLIVELLLYFCLWWSVYYEARCIDEEGKQVTAPTPSMQKPFKLNPNPSVPSPSLNVTNRRPIGFYSDKVSTQVASTQATQKPKTIVTQQTQQIDTKTQTSTQAAPNLTNAKKRVRMGVVRIYESYTDERFSKIKRDIKFLAKNGVRVDFDYQLNKVDTFLHTLPSDSVVSVNWNDGLILNYEL